MDRVSINERPRRREYTGQFKAAVLEQTRQPGASVSAVALSHGLNPNMVHRWLREARQQVALERLQGTAAAFVPLRLPEVSQASVASHSNLEVAQKTLPNESIQNIRIEIERPGSGSVTVYWPLSAAAQCAQLLRDVLR